MLQLVELRMVSLDVSNGPLDEALARLSRFATARRTDFVLRSQKAATNVDDWPSGKSGSRRTMTIGFSWQSHRDWPLVRRIETEAGPFDTLHGWIKSEAALS
jgi:hypothetical protein